MNFKKVQAHPKVKLFVGDLKLVREKIDRYETEEIAHIENVLEGEVRSREHRKLRRIEETISISEETAKEEEKNLESTERFELQKESEEVISEEETIEAGVKITVEYGPVKVEGNLNYGNTSNSVASSKIASKYAKDVTQKASTKVQERVKKERIRKTIEEFEETNKHGIDNSAGTEHTVGIYQWVNKFYNASLVNYGQRLMLDIMVPEPSAFLIKTLAQQPPLNSEIVEKPEPFEKAPADITLDNFQTLAKTYGATGIPFPPRKHISIATEFKFDDMGKHHYQESASKLIDIPQNYKAKSAYVHTSWYYGWDKDRSGFRLNLGKRQFTYKHHETPSYKWFDLTGFEDTKIPLTVSCRHRLGMAIGVSVLCIRTHKAYQEWQTLAHQMISEAYQQKLIAYEESKAAQAIQEDYNQIEGKNPAQNRITERKELKNGCIYILRNKPNGGFDNMGVDEEGFPLAHLGHISKNGKEVKFFEQSIDWENMTYKFYPYYWAERNRWNQILQLDNNDPIHMEFLQAGYARVVVPVRLGFEGAVLHYINTGNILGHQENPAISVPNLPIWEEFKDYPGDDPEAGIVEQEWEVKVPTSLVLLKPDGELPVFP